MIGRKTFSAVLTLAALLVSAAFPCAAQRKSTMSPRTSGAAETAVTHHANQAIEALLVRSDLNKARIGAHDVVAAKAGIRRFSAAVQSARLDSLFVDMEAAALQADTRSVLQTAMSLVELSPSDARSEIAGARILDLAANTPEFRAILPRIQRAIARGSTQSAYLRASLISAAADGMQGISPLAVARQSGLVTNWRVVGPFGRYPNLAFDRVWSPESDGLPASVYDGRPVESFQFSTGTFELGDYFSEAGVFYAASTLAVPAGGNWTLRVESPGTLKVSVDGAIAISKDDRFRATPDMVWKTLKLSAGEHHLVVKFLASAAPFRVALIPAAPPSRAVVVPSSPALAEYINAARAYWSGDYSSAIEQLTRMHDQHRSAAVDFLLAQAWSHADPSSTERTGLLESTLAAAPSAFAADYELAAKSYSEGHFDDTLVRLRRVTAAQPAFEPAIRLLAKAAAAIDWQAQASAAYTEAVALHPSCAVLQDASAFFSSILDYAKASAFERQLQGCAPGSLAWTQALSKAGRHADSAQAAESVVRAFPLDRTAQAFLIRELAMAGKVAEAKNGADRLLVLAPNSAEFRGMADALSAGHPGAEGVPAAIGFADAKPFYAAYRRDGVEITRKTAERRFSGGPAVLLLSDRIAELRPDGGFSLYVHKTTRVLDRDGILMYGEVSVPQEASIIELRTIKADGSIAEPEFNQHKATVSMPALSPGDAIDLEYVIRYESGAEIPEALHFTFGSFAAPILFSRFVVLTPADTALRFVPSGDVPSVHVEEKNGLIARAWERNDIAQWTSEVSMPATGVLPDVRVYPAADDWTGVRDYYRDALIGATRVGNRVAAAAELLSSATDEAKLRAIYRLVTSRIHSTRTDYSSGDFASAESTLSAFSGSRTAAMVALARAAHIDADVLMTRDAGSPKPPVATVPAYNRPLIVFHCKDGAKTRDILIDAESEGIGFGGIAARIERKDALLIPLQQGYEQKPLIAALPLPLLDERSVANADVSFDESGNLAARVSIRMGTARSAQMRAILGGIEPDGRKHFFEQLAMRIFPGAFDATGEVRNETDPDQTLEILLNCRALHFVNFQTQTADLDQLVPALGLRKLYAPAGGRRTPLYIDTPLIETAVFHVSLPDGMRFASLAGNMSEINEFGSYVVTFRQEGPNMVEIRREFRIPVQVIQPDRFEAFSRFAGRIDEAERQRLLIEHSGADTQAGR